MRNILKGFLEPQAEKYILPDASDIHFEEGISDFQLPSLDEEEQLPPEESELETVDVTVGEEEPMTPEPEPEPEQPEKPKAPETPVHYAQLQAELILNKAREEAEELLVRARNRLCRSRRRFGRAPGTRATGTATLRAPLRP